MRRVKGKGIPMTTFASTLAVVVGTAPVHSRRVFVGSNALEGILAYDWNPATGELKTAGVAARAPKVSWLAFSHQREYVYSASDLDMFDGKPTGEVASFQVENGQLHLLSTVNSTGAGTCRQRKIRVSLCERKVVSTRALGFPHCGYQVKMTKGYL